MIDERTIKVSSHGRYLVAAPGTPPPPPVRPAPLLVGFHGYAEDAALHLERLRTIPGSDRWLIVAIQGLHRFYRGRSQDVVASWMTRQDRELAVEDNVSYVAAVIDLLVRDGSATDTLVLAGFSQGAAMAYRAGALGDRRPSGVISLGGDVPPDLGRAALGRIRSALVGRGKRDAWYSSEKYLEDETRLRDAGVDVTTCPFDAGHEWTPDFSGAAGGFLARFA